MLFAKSGMAGAVAALVMMSAAANAGTFPDYGYQPPASYKGPLFHLSQDYPKTLPQGPLPAFFDLLPAKKTNNFEQWRPYMEADKNTASKAMSKTTGMCRKIPSATGITRRGNTTGRSGGKVSTG